MELEDLIERDLALTVQLPEGQERSVTVRGSEPVMDLLVTLCARYHLNPSDHVIELFSRNQNHIKFKPNSLIGYLEAERVELKSKRCVASKRVPNVPVATVRLIVNYRKSHKAVVRVNPRVPLAELMPIVCEKCELNPDTTLLLRDNQSEKPLDLTKTLNDYGLRDVYAKDMKAVSEDSPTATHKACQEQKLVTMEKGQVEKENRGLLCLFRRSKKAAEERASAPSFPVLSSQVSAGCLNANSSSSTPSSDMPKKRRAPKPPVMPGSQSIPSGLDSSQDANGPRDAANGKKDGLSGVSSTESSLKRTKRKAPPPPGISPSPSNSGDKERSYVGASINPNSLEDAEEAHLNDTSFDQDSDLPQSVPSSPLMTEILSEFMDRMNGQEEKRLSSEGSFTNPHQTGTQSPKLHTPLSGFLESDPMGQPTCKLMNHTFQRDGLTTFTVVPQRKQQSLHQYEFILTLESLDSLDQNNKESGKHPEGGNGDLEGSIQKKIENPELGDIRVITLDKTDEVQEMNEELTVSELAVKTVEELNLNEDACQRPLDRDKMEDQVEEVKDWTEEFRQKRRIFESDDEKPVKLHSKWSHKALLVDQLEAMIEDLPTSPLPVCWEEDIENLNPEESATALGLHKTKQKDDSETPTRYPKSNHENSDKHNDPYWDVNLSLDPFPDDSDTQRPPDSSEPKPDLNPPSRTYQAISPTQAKGHALSPSQDPVSKPKVQTSVEQPSPSSLSLFALAVSRRAQSLRQRACPLMLSAGGFSSPNQSNSYTAKGVTE